MLLVLSNVGSDVSGVGTFLFFTVHNLSPINSFIIIYRNRLIPTTDELRVTDSETVGRVILWVKSPKY